MYGQQLNSNGQLGVLTSVGDVSMRVPQTFRLEQNYPNPFYPTTQIHFDIGNESFVTLKVFDVLGREVSTLVNESKQAGSHKVIVDASTLSSGVYLYRLQGTSATNISVDTKRMILVK